MRTRTPTTPRPDAFAGAAASAKGDLAVAATGMAGTLALVLAVGHLGLALETAALFGAIAFVAVVAGFVYRPWVMVAATIPLYAIVPTLKVFVHPTTGAVKDLVSLAAVTAAGVVLVHRRVTRRPLRLDPPIAVLAGLIVALYLANVGGAFSGETGHGAAWAQGVRLFCQPLALLVVGLSLRDPRRTFRYAANSLVVTAAGVALVGLGQQLLGVDRLLELGYVYGQEVREIGPRLRSFGTLSEPFTYTSCLLIGLALVFLWSRRGSLTLLATGLISVGIAVAYVRTAALVVVALIGLALARRGHQVFAVLLLAGALIAGVTVLLAASQQTETRTVPLTPTTYLTLNGRTELWRSQIGDTPAEWLLGRGVGATGTAAERARLSLLGRRQVGGGDERNNVVDSGYLALVADIGVAGLLLLLALFARLAMLAWKIGKSGDRRGWAATGILLVLILDAMARESLTAFPTAHLSMLLVGLALARAADDREPLLNPPAPASR